MQGAGCRVQGWAFAEEARAGGPLCVSKWLNRPQTNRIKSTIQTTPKRTVVWLLTSTVATQTSTAGRDFPLHYLQKPPYVPTVLPNAGPADDPLPGCPRNAFRKGSASFWMSRRGAGAGCSELKYRSLGRKKRSVIQERPINTEIGKKCQSKTISFSRNAFGNERGQTSTISPSSRRIFMTPENGCAGLGFGV